MFIQGSGTREGSGKCMCDDGYRGKLCDSCVDGYYLAEINDTYVSCKGVCCTNFYWTHAI